MRKVTTTFLAALDDVDDLAATYRDPGRRAHGRPWLMLNMISALDGAISYTGISGTLGFAGDGAAFGVIRDLADVVLVGSGTVHAETYSAPSRSAEAQSRRRAAGAAGPLRYAVVTNSAKVDLSRSLFSDAQDDARPFLVTGQLDDARRTEISASADVIETGNETVDLHVAVDHLATAGATVILAEGGPHLNAALHAEDLIDELFLTVSPHLVGGSGPGILTSTDDEYLRRFDLVHALTSSDSEILTRWKRRR